MRPMLYAVLLFLVAVLVPTTAYGACTYLSETDHSNSFVTLPTSFWGGTVDGFKVSHELTVIVTCVAPIDFGTVPVKISNHRIKDSPVGSHGSCSPPLTFHGNGYTLWHSLPMGGTLTNTVTYYGGVCETRGYGAIADYYWKTAGQTYLAGADLLGACQVMPCIPGCEPPDPPPPPM